MELWWIGFAYVFGVLAKRLGQAPLIGFLVAGLFLEVLVEVFGVTYDTGPLDKLANIGIKLLLFVIGLKLDVRTVARPEVYQVTLLHMVASTLVVGSALMLLCAFGLPLVRELDLRAAMIVGFAASFSSTVFVVKMLEDRGDFTAFYGKVAVGALIVQDLVAVLFLGISEGKLPSVWAVGLLLLVFARPAIHKFLDWSGHGEVLALAGLALTLGGAGLFELVHMKGDLGALTFGLLAGGHAKSAELGKRADGFKDIFLVTFFLKVGLTGLPTLATMGVAALLVALAPLKAALFFVLFARYDLRARTSLLAAGGLANYSEFGLVVAAVAVTKGWLSSEWMVALALTLGGSLLLGSLGNRQIYRIYHRWHEAFASMEGAERLPEERPVRIEGAKALVFGMGQVGTGAFDGLRASYGDEVVGIDNDEVRVAEHQAAGRRVVKGSASDEEFWEQLEFDPGGLQAVVLATASQEDTLTALEQLRALDCKAVLAVAAEHPEEVVELREGGADIAVQLRLEAGVGLARDVLERVEANLPRAAGE